VIGLAAAVRERSLPLPDNSVCHAIGHVLGGTCDVPHYFCTAVMMPSVLRYNRPVTLSITHNLRALGLTR
jgi:alcohol dehydrogenase class IV